MGAQQRQRHEFSSGIDGFRWGAGAPATGSFIGLGRVSVLPEVLRLPSGHRSHISEETDGHDGSDGGPVGDKEGLKQVHPVLVPMIDPNSFSNPGQVWLVELVPAGRISRETTLGAARDSVELEQRRREARLA